MKNLPLLLGTIIGTVVLIVAVAFAFSGPAAQSADSLTIPEAELVGNQHNVKGATESAKVTIVEFSDLQCPACRAAQPLVEQVLATYADQVRLVFRHFPLDQIHPNARAAAVAAEAAREFGKFWEMHDVLFEKQDEWADITSQDELNAKFAEYAQQIQIDKAAFSERIEDSSLQAAVSEDAVYGAKIGIQATPTFFVNGQQVPVPQLLSAVESLLEQSDAPVASEAAAQE